MTHTTKALLSTCLLVAALVAVPGSRAEAPAELLLQGTLEDPVGFPMTGSQTLTVKLYDLPTGGTELYAETEVVPLDAQGVFTMTFGDGTRLYPFDFDRDLWAGITVDAAGGGSEITQRIQLHASPYAMRALVADVIEEAQVVHVAPDGTGTENGTALVAAITAANPTASAPVRIVLGPGTYDAGTTGVTMKSYLTLVGAGRDLTVVKGGTTGVAAVTMAADSALEQLKVQYSGTDASRVGVLVNAGSPTLEHVLVAITGKSGATIWGIQVTGTASPELRDVDVTVNGVLTNCTGIEVVGATASLLAWDLDVGATTCPTATGVRSAGTLRLFGSRIDVSGSGTSAAVQALDVDGGAAEVVDTYLAATTTAGGSDVATGLHVTTGSVVLNAATVTVTNATTQVGVETASGILRVHGSAIRSGGSTVKETGGTLILSTTLMAGGAVSGSPACYACYDEGFASTGPNICP